MISVQERLTFINPRVHPYSTHTTLLLGSFKDPALKRAWAQYTGPWEGALLLETPTPWGAEPRKGVLGGGEHSLTEEPLVKGGARRQRRVCWQVRELAAGSD